MLGNEMCVTLISRLTAFRRVLLSKIPSVMLNILFLTSSIPFYLFYGFKEIVVYY